MENVYVSIYLKIDLKIAQFPTLFSSAIELKTFDAKNGRKNILGICGIHYRIINCGGKCFDFKIARFPKYRIKRPMPKNVRKNILKKQCYRYWIKRKMRERIF